MIRQPSQTQLQRVIRTALHAVVASLLCLCVFGMVSPKVEMAYASKTFPAAATVEPRAGAVYQAAGYGLSSALESRDSLLPNGYAKDCSSPESCNQFDNETPGIDDDEIFVVAPHHDTSSMYFGTQATLARLNAITPRLHISELLRPPNY